MDSSKVSHSTGSYYVQDEQAYRHKGSNAKLSSFQVRPHESVDLSRVNSGPNNKEYGKTQSLTEKFSVVAVSTQKIEVKAIVQNALKAFMQNDMGLCKKFVNPSSPDCENSYALQLFRFFPIMSGILIDALLEKREPVTENDHELVCDVLKDREVKAAFLQLINATFSELDGRKKLSADHLLEAYKQDQGGFYDAIVDGIISHRKSLPGLQVAVDRCQLTHGFPVCYFPMLFGSKEDYYFGPDAHNFGANTIHTLCEAFGGLLGQLSSGDLQPVSLDIFCQIHKELTKDVMTVYGEPITPTDEFTVAIKFDIPKEKFTEAGFHEMMQFSHECDYKYRGMDKLSPDNYSIFHICGYFAPNDSCPGKVTITAYSDEPEKGNNRKKEVLIKVLVDYREELKSSPDPEVVRLSIAKLAKRLMMLNYFSDGNRRTIVFVINRELLRNGQSCSIILDADSITAKSSAEFSQVIKEGQDRFMGIQRNKHPTFFNPPIPCFHDQVQSKVYGYIEQGWKEMQKYTDI